MSNIVKHLPSYEILKKELDTNPENLKYYEKYESFIGDDKAVDYLINKLLEDDCKRSGGILNKIIKYISKKTCK